MTSIHTPISRLLTPLLQNFRSLFQAHNTSRTSSLPSIYYPTSKTFSTSPAKFAKQKGRPKKDPRITLIRYHLQHPRTPRPLRFSRMRALRHWTIHRAWMLARRKKLEAEETELMRLVPFHKSDLKVWRGCGMHCKLTGLMVSKQDVSSHALCLRRTTNDGSARNERCWEVISDCNGEEGHLQAWGRADRICQVAD